MTSGPAAQVVAVIPARGGSKRLPKKNLREIAGHPLLAHTILQARNSELVGAVFVSTDDDEIAAVAERYGAGVVRRPAELASDQSSSEAALLHAMSEISAMSERQWPAVMMLQCTSPVRLPGDIDNAVKQYWGEKADSLLSCCPAKHFVWRMRSGQAEPINYDYRDRPRSQDIEPQYQENGSIYITRTGLLLESQCRLGGKVAIYPMGFWSAFEIDDEDDFRLIEWIMRNRMGGAGAGPALKSAPKLLVFDFDGVMTDNTAQVDQDGRESVRVNRSDGLGIDLLRGGPVRLLVLSTEKNPVVAARCRKLDIECLSGIGDKAQALKDYLETHGIAAAETMYVGNDVNDLGCFGVAGCAVAVRDAHPDLLRHADIVLTRRGGDAAVREVCDMVLAALDR